MFQFYQIAKDGKNMKKILSFIVALTVVLSSVGVLANEIRIPDSVDITGSSIPTTSTSATTETSKVTFTDVDENTVAGKAIYKLVEAGILNGYQDGTFRPDAGITRAELCKIINLVFGYTEAATETFSDVSKEDWFYNYVAVAKKAGYIAGHADGTFKGNDNLTREQTCTIITRVTELFDLSMTETITDAVSEWAVPYVNKVVANKLMPLEADGKFRATENITRAELVSVVAGFVAEDAKVKYTATFNSNGGSTVASVTVDADQAFTKPIDPTKTGYSFEGWYTDSGLTTAYDFNTKASANITLYAKWDKNATISSGGSSGGGSSGGSSSSGSSSGSGSTTVSKYTVTFNSNGGSAVSNQTVESGDTASVPEDPTRTGCDFAGWYSDSALSTEYDFSSSITKNTTVYAKWTCTVHFEVDGGSYIDDAVVTYNTAVDEPEEPTKDGYKFLGWYKDENFYVKYSFSSKVTKEMTLYAKWLEIDMEKQQIVTDTMEKMLNEKLIASKVEGEWQFRGIRLLASEKAIMEQAAEIMSGVLKDAENGELVYDGDYVIDNYNDYVVEAKRIYEEEMSKQEQTDFYSKLETELGEEDAEQLLQIMFGMSISDAMGKLEQ